MLSRLAAMVKDVGVGAAGFFERISKYRHSVEDPLVIYGLGNVLDGAVIPGEPSRVDGDGPEGVEDVTDESALKPSLYGEPISVSPSHCSLRCLP
jgi:hypothetical protein